MSYEQWGKFAPGKATFDITSPELPQNWEFIYQNRQMLLRVDQYGPVYAQYRPPLDVMVFKRSPTQRYSDWFIWIQSPDFELPAFTNYWYPVPGHPFNKGGCTNYRVRYQPASVLYEFQYGGCAFRTRLFVPRESASVYLLFEVTNHRDQAISLDLRPSLRTYLNPAVLAPWDRPEWYLRTGFSNVEMPLFWTHLFNMNSELEKRRCAVLATDAGQCGSFEVSLEDYIGHGAFEHPDSLTHPSLNRRADKTNYAWGEYDNANSLFGYPPVNALQFKCNLAPGESYTIKQCLKVFPPTPEGLLPACEVAFPHHEQASLQHPEAELQAVETFYDDFLAKRESRFPDQELTRYVNEWLPLQLEWVCSLDRGWPSGMRGTRDSANDFNALIPLDPQACHDLFLTLFSCQRRDGWFPRQYSAAGREGKHDLRQHVDAGYWVIEYLYDYLCWTRDYDILHVRCPWLDSEKEDPLWVHVQQALEYFVRPDHLGPHGLCLIGEGDWLDAVNRAGMKGRGESVTVTAQTLIAIKLLEKLLNHLNEKGDGAFHHSEVLLFQIQEARQQLQSALMNHALNAAGYFNSVCTDDGVWLFSDNDPDGRQRVYGPANWFVISSGILTDEQQNRVLGQLETLRCESGYRLFSPPMGDQYIANVGRVGSGDMPAGLWENANVYNQGSHGFLGRALAVAGDGNRLCEVLEWLLPHDQEKHPTPIARTPPYAVVNCWNQVPGYAHRGGLVFLTGSIAYGMRMVYDWMLGIRPSLDGLILDPCIPEDFDDLHVRFDFLKTTINLQIKNPNRKQTGIRKVMINGKEIKNIHRVPDLFANRSVVLIPDHVFQDRSELKIEIEL